MMITRKLFLRGSLLGTALLISVTSLFAFEGRIDMQMRTTKSKEPMTLLYLVKGKLLRTEMQIEGRGKKQSADQEAPNTIVSIIDLEKREVMTLMQAQKMYMVHTLPENMAKEAEKKRVEHPFKATGRKETIAGIPAEEYVCQYEKTWIEVWVTKELGHIMTSGTGKNPSKGNAWDAFLSTENFFSLRTITRAKEGAPEDMHLEVVKIEKTSLPDNLFMPPSDYKKMEMPSLGGMLKGLTQ